jgi:hypothetical protein
MRIQLSASILALCCILSEAIDVVRLRSDLGLAAYLLPSLLCILPQDADQPPTQHSTSLIKAVVGCYESEPV